MENRTVWIKFEKKANALKVQEIVFFSSSFERKESKFCENVDILCNSFMLSIESCLA